MPETKNPYSSPQSDLLVETDADINLLSSFPRFSAWYVFLLNLVTLGIYQVYWLYTRSKAAKAANIAGTVSWAVTVVAIFIVLQVLGIYQVAVQTATVPGVANLDVVVTLLNLVYMGIWLIAIFTLRGNLRDAFQVRLSGPLTFFFSIIYLQYKINQLHDSNGESAESQVIV